MIEINAANSANMLVAVGTIAINVVGDEAVKAAKQGAKCEVGTCRRPGT